MYQVYALVNKINGKMYVGSTKRDLKIRLKRHFVKANEGSVCSIHKALRKYGKDNFDIRMIEEFSTRKDMLDGEISWISYFNTYKSKYGYNDTPGGDGGNTNSGKKFSPKWVIGISKSLAGKPQISKRKFSEEIEKEICRLYLEEKKSAYLLGKDFNCNRNTIFNILKRNNLEIRKSNYTGHNNCRNIFSIEQHIDICNMYLIGNISRQELSRKFNCGKTTIRDILLRYNIKL